MSIWRQVVKLQYARSEYDRRAQLDEYDRFSTLAIKAVIEPKGVRSLCMFTFQHIS